MKIQKRWPRVRGIRFHTGMRTMSLLFIAFVTGAFAFMQTTPAGAVQTTAQYCSQYTSNSKLNACKDGVRGADCGDYAITFDQDTADVCTKAAKAKSDGLISDTPSVNPSTNGSNSTDVEVYRNAVLNACAPYASDSAAAIACLYGGLGKDAKEDKPKTIADCLNATELQGSTRNQGACITGSAAGQSFLAEKNGNTDQANNINTNANAVQDALDQTSNLSQYIDLLHATGQDSGVDMGEQADNTYGFYINGAGKQQAITPTPSGVSGGPAIIFFNGGGWHSDDKTSQFVTEGSAGKNGDPNDSEHGPPVGGGATARGFTTFNATYRLGSSGVYYMFEDVMRAIQHVRNNADMYDIDPNKIAIWGDSSGGSLAMRANATGKSGAKVAVGWSPPTNAYTGLFRSYKSLLIGMDHSTCAPTDIAGAANFTDLLNGGSGDIAQYDGSLANWGLGSVGEIGQNNGSFQPLDLLTQVLTAGQYAAQTSQNIESISSQLESGGIAGMSGGVINLASKKLVECLDNFNALSPALFASPDSSPAFLAGFETDDVVGPEQVYEMRDKLRSLGIRSEAMVLQGDPDAGAGPFSPTKNHLGYDPRFVCDTLNFVDEIIQTGKHVDCANGTATDASDEGGEGAGGGGSEGGSPGGGGPSGGQEPSESSCAAEGKVFRGKGQSPDNPSVFRGAGCQTQSVYLREECITNGGTYTPGDREGDIGSCAPKKENCLDKVFPTCKGKTYTLKGKGCPKGTQPVMTGPSGKRYVICQ